MGEGYRSYMNFWVSHDRDLVSDTATRVLSTEDQGLIDFQGIYEE
jgi:ATPase subunit of ABC transporter with duplicated ATPase domains